MTTLDDVLEIQRTQNILYPPTINTSTKVELVKSYAVAVSEGTATTNSTLTLSLYNASTASTVYAYVTGLAINNNSATCLIESDGSTVYYPANPAAGVNGVALAANCAIPLGAAGTSKTVTIPYIAGGRIWFSYNNTLTFTLNNNSGGTSPGLCEPSISNTSDPNYNITWDFCEFTFNSAQIYANITYVDFVALPIALTLTNTSGTTTHIAGIPTTGLNTICANLIAQNAIDGAGWENLVVSSNGTYVRAISPNNGVVMNSSLFSTYWTSYIQQCWAKYQTTSLTVDTQNSTWGTVTGTSNGTVITFPGIGTFAQPSAGDIFSASTGPFTTSNSAEMQAIGARINAAINRGTFLTDTNQPDGEVTSTFYTTNPCNHYCRIVHAANLDGRGYAMPFDDVVGPNMTDQSGYVADGSPQTLTISIGGAGAYAKRQEAKMGYRERARLGRRDMGGWLEDVKIPVSMSDAQRNVDLEMGQRKLVNEASEFAAEEVAVRRFKLPPAVEKVVGPILEKFYNSPFYQNYLLPFLILLHQFIVAALSLSVRTVISRAFIVLCFLLFYFLGLLKPGQNGEVIMDGAVTGRVMEGSVADNLTMLVQGNN